VLKETSIKDKEIEKFLNEFQHVEKNENNEHTDLQSNKQMKRNKSYLSNKANYNFLNKGGNNPNINEKIKQMYLNSLFNKSGNNLDDL
jgi:predicted metal-dependent peptidase